ncbi:MAG: hypothetical protein WCG25_00295 [bacterium]|jgi:sensor domain CHASE-containing protein
MKKVYLFITVLLALIISYSMAATYTATEQDKTNVNAYVNKVSTLIDSKLKKTPTNKQATVVQSTLKSLRFV